MAIGILLGLNDVYIPPANAYWPKCGRYYLFIYLFIYLISKKNKTKEEEETKIIHLSVKFNVIWPNHMNDNYFRNSVWFIFGFSFRKMWIHQPWTNVLHLNLYFGVFFFLWYVCFVHFYSFRSSIFHSFERHQFLLRCHCDAGFWYLFLVYGIISSFFVGLCTCVSVCVFVILEIMKVKIWLLSRFINCLLLI